MALASGFSSTFLMLHLPLFLLSHLLSHLLCISGSKVYGVVNGVSILLLTILSSFEWCLEIPSDDLHNSLSVSYTRRMKTLQSNPLLLVTSPKHRLLVASRPL